jgi:hypothetical protein
MDALLGMLIVWGTIALTVAALYFLVWRWWAQPFAWAWGAGQWRWVIALLLGGFVAGLWYRHALIDDFYVADTFGFTEGTIVVMGGKMLRVLSINREKRSLHCLDLGERAGTLPSST